MARNKSLKLTVDTIDCLLKQIKHLPHNSMSGHFLVSLIREFHTVDIMFHNLTQRSLFSQALCSTDCGPHGECQGTSCVCDPGWEGPRCAHQKCHPLCQQHGQCKNGTCVCQRGWNGKHCSISGCGGQGKLCHGHGSCTTSESAPAPADMASKSPVEFNRPHYM